MAVLATNGEATTPEQFAEGVMLTIEPIGAAGHIRLVLGFGADAGDSQKFFEAEQGFVTVGIDVFKDLLKHARIVREGAERKMKNDG